MRIERKLVPVEDFAEWVERHDLTIELMERGSDRPIGIERFYAYIKGAEIKDNGFLRGSFSNSENEADCIARLPAIYSEKTIVFDAYKPTRRELVCPRFKGC